MAGGRPGPGESASKLGHEPNESPFLNAEDAEALAEVRKGQTFSASFVKNSGPSAVI